MTLTNEIKPYRVPPKMAAPATEDDECQVTGHKAAETMEFAPVDQDWQKSQTSALGLKVQVPVPTKKVKSVTAVELPTEKTAVHGDGNCFFRAISQLLTGAQSDHKFLRNYVVQFMDSSDKEFSDLAMCPGYAANSNMQKLDIMDQLKRYGECRILAGHVQQ
ncbi:hypothetical protein LSAT2_000370 [Lamellibrachia satsuma]|nr:hypothetical protein LSAT2_000370 [Lamellibrachia satsuma]